MIGFQPTERDMQEYVSKEEKPYSKPGEKDVPPGKPDIEITSPKPSSVPFPQPDTIESSPAPEIKPIPAESPAPTPTPEISPVQPAEFS